MTDSSNLQRNQTADLDLGWVQQIKVNRNAADRRAASLVNRRGVKKDYQAAWLLKVIESMDLTP